MIMRMKYKDDEVQDIMMMLMKYKMMTMMTMYKMMMKYKMNDNEKQDDDDIVQNVVDEIQNDDDVEV